MTEDVRQVVQGACDVYGVRFEDVMCGSRKMEVSRCRHAICYALRTGLGMGYHEIGKHLGLDHSSVMYGCDHAPVGKRTKALLAYARSLA